MQYAFGVQVYGEVLYLEFYSVLSESYTVHEILLCKRLQSYVILHTLKEQCIAIVKWKTDSPSRICSRHFENKCYRSLYCKRLWNNAVPIDVAVTTDFHVQVIKKDHNYALPSSQETIQLLQDSAEMGMKYRERCYNLQKR
jgi:hypothetical protein